MRLGDEEVMKVERETGHNGFSMAAISAIFFSLLFLLSCSDSRNRNDLAIRMAVEEGRGEDDKRIAELRNEIREVEKEVESTIEAVRNKGTYWRLLGLKYMDYRMWEEAASAFREAIAVNPDFAVFHYNSGLCYAQMALSLTDWGEKLAYNQRSESEHRRALELDSRYTPAMYALANLLIFEMDRPQEAEPILRDYLKIERSQVKARFLLARVLLEAGRREEALDVYDEISRIATSKADADQAKELSRRVSGGENGL